MEGLPFLRWGEHGPSCLPPLPWPQLQVQVSCVLGAPLPLHPYLSCSPPPPCISHQIPPSLPIWHPPASPFFLPSSSSPLLLSLFLPLSCCLCLCSCPPLPVWLSGSSSLTFSLLLSVGLFLTWGAGFLNLTVSPVWVFLSFCSSPCLCHWGCRRE